VDEKPHETGDVPDGDRLEEGIPAHAQRAQAVLEQKPDQDEKGREAQQAGLDENPRDLGVDE
jgi:hypothetical protein